MHRIRVDVPECRRCCFCMPLRYGLLTWGYIKLIIMCFITAEESFYLKYVIQRQEYHLLAILKEVFVFGLNITDILLTVTLIIGCHKKNVLILKVFFYGNICQIVTTSLITTYDMIDFISYDFKYSFDSSILFWDGSLLCLQFLAIALEGYLLLLVRSEIFKLKNARQFRFVNNAAEAMCSMDEEHPVISTETGLKE